MHIWQKFVTPQWFARNEARLQNATRGRHAVIEHSNRKRVLVECSCSRIGDAQRLARNFGGSFRPLPADWLESYQAFATTKSIRVGKRLMIAREAKHRAEDRHVLVIPAETAFGTGDHATTAMSLRLLEEITREMKAGWSLVDLGTGSGILALAAKCFGADAILAIDNDAQAIRIAKQNAHRNKIRGVKFEVRDVLGPKDRHKKFDLITANLFSELLIKALPIWKARLKRNGRMILSGILREQLPQLRSALRRERLSILQIRRRGKWVALLVE
jgi:ribosomal protein L11 methyltransferase